MVVYSKNFALIARKATCASFSEFTPAVPGLCIASSDKLAKLKPTFAKPHGTIITVARRFYSSTVSFKDIIADYETQYLKMKKELVDYQKELRRVEEKLKLYENFAAAEITYNIFNKFVEKILVPQKYLRKEDPQTAENIKNAFMAFLKDDTNHLAMELKNLLSEFSVEEIVESGCKSFRKMSANVQRALNSYLNSNNDASQAFDPSLIFITQLDEKEKIIVNKVAEFLFDNNLMSY